MLRAIIKKCHKIWYDHKVHKLLKLEQAHLADLENTHRYTWNIMYQNNNNCKW